MINDRANTLYQQALKPYKPSFSKQLSPVPGTHPATLAKADGYSQGPGGPGKASRSGAGDGALPTHPCQRRRWSWWHEELAAVAGESRGPFNDCSELCHHVGRVYLAAVPLTTVQLVQATLEVQRRLEDCPGGGGQ
jgi:hypothetical protein